jgi:hypothetical protein
LKAADAAAIAWTELATIRPTTGAGAIALINSYLEIWSEQPSKVDYREVSGALKTLRALLRSNCGVGRRPSSPAPALRLQSNPWGALDRYKGVSHVQRKFEGRT